jgi:hypothetical protein
MKLQMNNELFEVINERLCSVLFEVLRAWSKYYSQSGLIDNVYNNRNGVS